MNIDSLPTKRGLLLWYGLLFALFLVVANVGVFVQQKADLERELRDRAETELDLLSLMTREVLLREDYALVRYLLGSWAESHNDVVSLSVDSEKGIPIVAYARANIDGETRAFQRKLSLTNRRHAMISLGLSTAPDMARLDLLRKQMLLVSAASTAFLALIVWIVLRHLAIKPLEKAVEDVSDRQRKTSKEYRVLQSVIDGVTENIMVIDAAYEVKLANVAARRLWDESKISDPEHPRCYEVSHHRSTPCDGTDHPCPLRQVLETEKPGSVVHNHPDKAGNPHYVELAASPWFDSNGKLTGIIEAARDITSHLLMRDELQEKQHELVYQAQHDSLTGLPNRLLLNDRLTQGIRAAKRAGRQLALLFIDLDEFKQINDGFGHEVGDEVLRQISTRLENALRACDTVARIGGDEFNVVLMDLESGEHAGRIAENLIREVRQPCTVDSEQFLVTCSIGISVYPRDADQASELMRNADAAMFKAKESGRNAFCFYTQQMTHDAYRRVVLEKELHTALADHQFELHYQPQCDALSGRIIGVEALIRWRHPRRGLLLPGEFIGLAESTGLIVELGHWVLATACAQAATWYGQGLDPGRVTLNLSVRELRQPDLAMQIAALLEATSCRPEWIEFEVTESWFMDHPVASIRVLNEIRDQGIAIAIDDFGTGYSSLSSLKKLPVERLKIDQSFVDGLPGDADDVAITCSIIGLAKSLSLDLVAEGVEEQGQLNFLRDAGCSKVQGFLLGQPLTVIEMTRLLRDQDPHPVAL